MPLYEYECPNCGNIEEHQLPLADCDINIYCSKCTMRLLTCMPMRKLFNKITPVQPAQTRKWGTSFYRSHDRGKQIGKPKLPANSPPLRMCAGCGVSEEASPTRLIWWQRKWWCPICLDVRKESL